MSEIEKQVAEILKLAGAQMNVNEAFAGEVRFLKAELSRIQDAVNRVLAVIDADTPKS